ncbi:MAG: methionyl-tRNA formyltransferase [Candidatus Omnitrophica bacterium]|nr:methionyl-tRNA formyltransferase [Candidatus Omnitrophota bacterium]
MFKKKLDFIYLGSAEFSRITLETLCEQGFVPRLIISGPDKPKGRKLISTPTSVSVFARENKIDLIKPISLNDADLCRLLQTNPPKCLVLADYGKILPPWLLNLSEIPLGIHPSLLPKYRGAAPVNWALIEGAKETGVTLFKINDVVDSGEILASATELIKESDDIMSLSRRLAVKGANLLIENADAIEQATFRLERQDSQAMSYARKLTKNDGRILWSDSALKIHNKVRALLGWPSSFLYYEDKPIKVISTEIASSEGDFVSGTILNVDRRGIEVATAKGILRIKKIQPPGKNVMAAYSFSLGHSLKPGKCFR